MFRGVFTLTILFLRVTFADSVGTGLNDLFHVPSNPGALQVEKELECIQSKTNEKLAFIRQPQATEMIKLLAPHLQAAFTEFGLGPQERALFYSQVIEESGGFTQLSESTQYSHVGNDPINQIVNEQANDVNFKKSRTKSSAVKRPKSRSFGEYRGRGLIQITGCSNFLSVAHYLNSVYSGGKRVWLADWKYYDQNEEEQTLEQGCSKAQLRSALNVYQEKYGKSADLYGALSEPTHFAMIGAELTDPMSKKKIASERFMVEASLAYWRGRCGETVKTLTAIKSPDALKPCAEGPRGELIDRISQCLTKCVKGRSEGWEARGEWLKKAMLCTY